MAKNKRKISILILTFVLILTNIPNFAYAEFSDLISDLTDTSIEEMAEEELNGEAPEPETENEKFSSSIDGLAFNSVYLMEHLNKSYIDLDEFDLSCFYNPVTAVKGVATYNRHRQSNFAVTEDNYIAGMQYQIPLYDLSANSNYYVCVPNANMGNTNFPSYDLMIAYNNDAGELVPGCHYENDILYIPKKAIDNPTYTVELSDASSIIAVQFNYIIGDSMNLSKEIPVQVLNGDKPKNKVVQCPNIFDSDRLVVETGIRFKDHVDLYLNGQMIPMFSDAYSYDSITGEMQIYICPGVVSNINIVFGEGDMEISSDASENAFASEDAISSDATANSMTSDAIEIDGDESEKTEPPKPIDESISGGSDSLLDNFIEKTEEVVSSFLDLTVEKVNAVTPSNMTSFANSSGTKTELLRLNPDNMFVGWRGYYTPQGSGSHPAQIHGNSSEKQTMLNNAPGWKNSVKYMYAGYTSIGGDGSSYDDEKFDARMKWTWAISSYAMGVDIGKAHKNTVLTANKKVTHNSTEDKSETHTIWEWFNDLRTNLEKSNGTTTVGKANGLGGSTNFAIKFPSSKRINGADESLVSKGANEGRTNETIPWESENTPKVISGAEDYYYAASCNHLDTAAGEEGFSKVYVTCVGCSLEGEEDDWVALAFVMNRSGQAQDACGIYKFAVKPEPDGKLKIVKVISGGDGSKKGFIFTVTNTKTGVSKDFTTPESGIINISDIDPGTYTITETIPPDKTGQYTDITKSYTVTITGSETKTITVEWENSYKSDAGIASTTATAHETAANVHYAKAGVTVTDEVALEDLSAGATYRVDGTLVDKDSGAVLDNASRTITASDVTDTVSLTYSMDASSFLARSAFCNADLYIVPDDGEPELLDSWSGLDDDMETIHYPKITTEAIAVSTNNHIMKAASAQAVTETISYFNVASGKQYTAISRAFDKNTGEIIGTEEKSIYASTEDGKITLDFILDARYRKGHTIGFTSELYYNDILVADHLDLDDENECIHIPKILTYCTDDETNDKFAMPGKNHTARDMVYIYNVLPGYEYTLDGEYIHPQDMAVVSTGKTTFVAPSADCVMEVKFALDVDRYPYTYVAFEDLLFDGISVADHKYKDAESQTVRIARINTLAHDAKTGSHIMLAEKKTASGLSPDMTFEDFLNGKRFITTSIENNKNKGPLFDTVFYRNFLIGRTFDVKSSVYDHNTKEYLGISAVRTITPTRHDGKFDMYLQGDFTNLAGRTIVLMDEIKTNEHFAAVHWDYFAESQIIHIPKLETTLKEIGEPGEGFLSDELRYYNLIPYKNYLIIDVLVDNATGHIVAKETKTFIPSSADGIQNMYFKDKKLQGKTVTAFAYIYYDCTSDAVPNKLVARHADVGDKDQTVTVKTLGIITITDIDKFFDWLFDGFVNTGDTAKIILYMIILIASSAAGLYFATRKKKKK